MLSSGTVVPLWKTRALIVDSQRSNDVISAFLHLLVEPSTTPFILECAIPSHIMRRHHASHAFVTVA
jgi:hypothetical protein